jgi:hypothetical protein
VSRPIATEAPGWDFDYEGLWQFGSFGSAGIRAWTAASETGYRFAAAPLKPRLSVKADISSGDNPKSNTFGTFNPLFPKGNYFGVLATTGPGPINFIDLHPRIETALPHKISASVDWIFQWRESLEDGVYAVPGFLITAANGSARGTLETDRGRKCAGRPIGISGFRRTTAFFLPAHSSSKRDPDATSITGRSGRITNSSKNRKGVRRSPKAAQRLARL